MGDLQFSGAEVLVADAGQVHPLLKESGGVRQSDTSGLQGLDRFLQLDEGLFKGGLVHGITAVFWPCLLA